MKKNLFPYLSVLAVLILFINACSMKPAYTNAIPADATEVVSINLKSLAEKAGVNQKENKEALQKLTDALKSGMNAATFQQLEMIMKDPSKSGIDVEEPIYLFSTPTSKSTTVLAKVISEDDLKNLLELAQKEQLSSAITNADGYNFVTANNQIILAFNAHSLLIVNYQNSANLDKAKQEITALLKQTAENSIAKSTTFKKMQKMNGDVTMFVSPTSLLNAYAKQLNYNFSESNELKDLIVLGSLSFEKGKIELQMEYDTENEALKALLKEQQKSILPIENTFLKYFPKSTIALLSMGLNGEELYNVLQQNEQFRKEFSLTKAEEAEIKNLLGTFQNDLTIGLINVTMSNAPSFLAYASVKSNSSLESFYEKKAELGLKRGEEIVKLNENEYVYKSRKMNIFFGIRDKQMYATNDELLYKNIGKTVEPSLKEISFAADLKGKQAAFVLNISAILELPLVKMIAEYSKEEYQTYYSLANNISHLEVITNKNKATITLQLKDENVNALQQMVNFVKEFAGF